MNGQDIINNDLLQIMTTAPAKFTYSSYPRTVHYKSYRETNSQPSNSEKRSYGNVMYDKRVVRGNTWAMKRNKEASLSNQSVKVDVQKLSEKNKEIRRRVERQRKTGDKVSGDTSTMGPASELSNEDMNKVENLTPDRDNKEDKISASTADFSFGNEVEIWRIKARNLEEANILLAEGMAKAQEDLAIGAETLKNLYIENAQLKNSIDKLEVNRVSLILLNEQLIPKSLEHVEKLEKLPMRSSKTQSTQTDTINIREEKPPGDVEKNWRLKIDSDIVNDFIPYIFNQVQMEVNKRLLSKILFDAVSFQNTYCRTKSKEHLIDLVNHIL